MWSHCNIQHSIGREFLWDLCYAGGWRVHMLLWPIRSQLCNTRGCYCRHSNTLHLLANDSSGLWPHHSFRLHLLYRWRKPSRGTPVAVSFDREATGTHHGANSRTVGRIKSFGEACAITVLYLGHQWHELDTLQPNLITCAYKYFCVDWEDLCRSGLECFRDRQSWVCILEHVGEIKIWEGFGDVQVLNEVGIRWFWAFILNFSVFF